MNLNKNGVYTSGILVGKLNIVILFSMQDEL